MNEPGQKKDPSRRLAEINRAITTSLNFDRVFDLIAESAFQLVRSRVSVLLLVDNDGLLRIHAARGADAAVIESFSGGMQEEVIEQLHKSLAITDDETFVSVPIIAKDSLTGLLVIASEFPLSEEEEWQLSALADQAAIALRNARLYELELAEATRERDKTLEALSKITERRQAEITKHLLAAIVESSDDAIVSKDLSGVISSWNKGAERIFGYKAEEVIGKPVTVLIPPDRFDEEPAILARIRQGRLVDHYETIRQRKDGTLIDVSLTTSPIRDEGGAIIGASKIARDISESKRRAQETRFQAHLLDTVEQAVIATDLNGKVTYWNAYAEWLYGWTKEEAVGASVLDLIPGEGGRAQAADILAKLRAGESWSGEFRARRKDGTEFPAMVTDSPIFDQNGRLVGMVGVSSDISDRKRAEEERASLLESERKARSDAETANRLKDEFLATLSHELRNPLNVILGYTEVLLRSEEAKRSSFVKRAAETLKRNALSQSQLVRDLLDLSRLHMGKLSINQEPVSLTTTIGNAVETVRAEAAAKGVDIRIDASDQVLFVDGDPLRMEQVVWNLLNNAVKFTPSGGKVTVRLSRTADRAILVVEDTGQGIDPEFLPHVFEMFRQADGSSSRNHGGMGIGLALVEELVDLHGGTVQVYSAGRNRGASFTIEIPLSLATEQTLGTSARHDEQSLKQMQILVVDDSDDTIEMLQRLFEMDGALVCTARSGAEALQIAREKEFDAVLSDISMPGMDGFEFLRQFRAIPKKDGVPVLALTGFGRPEDVERATEEGFFSHVTKPIDINSLVEILRQLPVKDRRSGQLENRDADGNVVGASKTAQDGGRAG